MPAPQPLRTDTAVLPNVKGAMVGNAVNSLARFTNVAWMYNGVNVTSRISQFSSFRVGSDAAAEQPVQDIGRSISTETAIIIMIATSTGSKKLVVPSGDVAMPAPQPQSETAVLPDVRGAIVSNAIDSLAKFTNVSWMYNGVNVTSRISQFSDLKVGTDAAAEQPVQDIGRSISTETAIIIMIATSTGSRKI